MPVRTYQVPDISCGHCKATITEALRGVAGVDAVEVDLTDKVVKVAGDATVEMVTGTLAGRGYAVAGCA